MKEKIIKALINGAIGILTSVATIYIGASAAEAVAVSGATTATVGGRVADTIAVFFG